MWLPFRLPFDPGRLIDLLPRTRAARRSDLARAAAASLERAFTGKTDAERERILRGFLRGEVTNRIIYRLHNRFPRAAQWLARLIPIGGQAEARALFAADGPLIVAGGHFGPVFWVLTILQAVAHDRTLHVLFAERGRDRPFSEKYMRDVGMVAYMDEPVSVRALLEVLKHDPRAIVVLAYDHFATAQRPFAFLDTTIRIPDGIGYFADRGDAPILPLNFVFDRRGMRLNFSEILRTDPTLRGVPRRRDVTDRMFRLLEAQVRVMPERWTEWPWLPHAAASADSD